ncbi:helix-turn-helix transcriptional regulator [Clostridium cellulovorans]|uniref:Sigma-70 region 4 type 2 n=1 Tax=Clostridium cellulovorans (strain ATCC 35296 / DSM 3052 / OCM 3 / 743B) TaxID=573061 RepID=D9SSH2_CLOC7|nr:helix-turn-helix transcriptional regulator [Clostridium cellulovorans]ADL50569.1 hypothetical protein Clocel_0799 [Clostridium cellulovorans 743B]
MTSNQKEEIKKMRQDGNSYSKIAIILGISENTIKSYCRRNNLGINKVAKPDKEEDLYTVCKNCGKPLEQGTKGHRKKFCSDICRRSWWRDNEVLYNKKAFYKIKCLGCGKEFESYGNKERKFCGHSCYINYRFEKAEVRND